jgi:hypothetical protein
MMQQAVEVDSTLGAQLKLAEAAAGGSSSRCHQQQLLQQQPLHCHLAWQ